MMMVKTQNKQNMRKSRGNVLTLCAALMLACVFAPQSAHAQCADPVGVVGEIVMLEPPHNVPVYCDANDNWIAMNGGQASQSCTASSGPFVLEDTYNTSIDAAEVWGDGTYLYVADANGGGVYAFGFDGSTLTLLDTYDDGFSYFDITSDGTYIYVIDDWGGIAALTFDGTTFTEEGADWGSADNFYEVIWSDGTYIYASDYGEGLEVLSFDGSTFTVESENNDGHSYECITGDDNYIYACDPGNGSEYGFAAFSFDGSTLTFLDSENTGQMTWSYSAATDGTYIYVGTNPKLQALTFDGSDFTIVGDSGYIATNSYSWQVETDGTYIYAVDSEQKLDAFTFDGSSFTGPISTSGTPINQQYGSALWSDESTVYVADGTDGLKAFSGFGCSGGNSASNLTEIVPDGLIGHWRLDEEDGTTAFDSSVGGNDADMESGLDGGTNSVAGVVGTALQLNRPADVNHRIVTSDVASLGGISEITFSAWLKPESMQGHRGVFQLDNIGSMRLNFDGDDLRFRPDGWDIDTGQFRLTGNTGLPLDKWTHVVVSYSYLDPIGTKPVFYFNGVQIDPGDVSEQSPPDGAYTPPATSRMRIGVQEQAGWRDFEGAIDDVRLYNRVLDPDEVVELYQARDGIRYNQSHREYEYFDGNRFMAMTPEWPEPDSSPQSANGYAPYAQQFETTSYLDHDGALAASDSPMITASFWINIQTDDNFDEIFRRDGNGIRFAKHSSDRLTIWLSADGGATLFRDDSPNNTMQADDGWLHVLFSVDLSDPAGSSCNRCHLYINDTEYTISPGTWNNGNINFADASDNMSFGEGSGADHALADFWLDAGTYIDFSVEANRRKFIDASGNPVNLGSDGSVPTGSQPEIFMSGDPATWHENKGSADGFTKNGTVTTIPGPGVLSEGLVGHWKLDETEGTTAVDATGNIDGALTGSMDAEDDTSPGAVGTSLIFDGIDDVIEVPANAAIDNLANGDFTASAWIRMDRHTTDNSDPNWRTRILAKRSGGGGNNSRYGWYMTINDSRQVAFHTVYNDVGDASARASEVLDLGVWTLITARYSSATGVATLYINGVESTYANQNTGSQSSGFDDSGDSLSIGNGSDANDHYFAGAIDDVRLYDRLLSENEITRLYQMGTPAGTTTALPQGCPNIGDVCDDGTIYAGQIGGGTTEMYLAKEDAPTTMNWNDGSSNFTSASATDLSDGLLNTNNAVASDADGVSGGFQVNEAIQYCYDLVAHGADDWYLPARQELNAVCQDGALHPYYEDSLYLTSTEDTDTVVRTVRLNNAPSCGYIGVNKNQPQRLRCVRKGPAPRCASPYGIEGQMIYNTDHDVVQFCDGARWRAIGKYQ